MRIQPWLRRTGRLFASSAAVYVALVAATALVCWLGDLRNVADFGTGLIWTGIVSLMVGLLSMKGVSDVQQNVVYRRGRQAPAVTSNEWQRVDQSDILNAYRFLYVVATAGTLSLLSGLLIRSV